MAGSPRRAVPWNLDILRPFLGPILKGLQLARAPKMSDIIEEEVGKAVPTRRRVRQSHALLLKFATAMCLGHKGRLAECGRFFFPSLHSVECSLHYAWLRGGEMAKWHYRCCIFGEVIGSGLFK